MTKCFGTIWRFFRGLMGFTGIRLKGLECFQRCLRCLSISTDSRGFSGILRHVGVIGAQDWSPILVPKHKPNISCLLSLSSPLLLRQSWDSLATSGQRSGNLGALEILEDSLGFFQICYSFRVQFHFLYQLVSVFFFSFYRGSLLNPVASSRFLVILWWFYGDSLGFWAELVPAEFIKDSPRNLSADWLVWNKRRGRFEE